MTNSTLRTRHTAGPTANDQDWINAAVAALHGLARRDDTHRWLDEVFLPSLQARESFCNPFGADRYGRMLIEYIDAGSWALEDLRAASVRDLTDRAVDWRFKADLDRDAVQLMPLLVQAKVAPVTWEWQEQKPDGWREATIHMGPLSVEVTFTPWDGPGGWRRDWRASGEVSRLSHIAQSRNMGTGLFPKITEGLRQVTIAFLEEVQPDRLVIHGIDAKRNTYNAAHYGAWAPEGYDFHAIHAVDGNTAATNDGTVAVAFERREPRHQNDRRGRRR